MRAKWLVLLISVFTAVALWGCGSSGSGGSEVSGGTDEVVPVGLQNCDVCHTAIVDTWEGGVGHNNENSLPDTNYFGNDPADCSVCHDPTGDSAIARVPVVGCEGCHGGGSAHRGVGPLPNPYPDPDTCAECHDAHGYDLGSAVVGSTHNNADDLHASRTRCQRCHSKEGSILLKQYTGDADVMHLMDSLDPIAAEEDLHPVTCSACHVSHDGSGRWEEAIALDYTLDSVIYNSAWDPNGNEKADQFDFCTSCHTYYNQDGVLIGSGETLAGSSPVLGAADDTLVPWEQPTAPHYHNTAWYRVIPTTHYDNPFTGPQENVAGGGSARNTLVEGYVIRQTVNGEVNERPCFDCHGHEFRTNTRRSRDVPEPGGEHPEYGSTIHTQWASSAHAAHLLNAKYAAADGTENRTEAQVNAVQMAAASDDTADGGFTHYNWDSTTRYDTEEMAVVLDRGDCQMCHTATGAMNFLTDPAAYDPLENDFSHLDGWSLTGGANGETVSSSQNELLYCWACHEDAGRGQLRSPGPITLAYLNLAGEKPVMPDLDHSNVCINCHSGRGGMYRFLQGSSGTNPPAVADPAGAGINGGTRTHYYAAGATLQQELTNVGYMYYDSAAYADVSFYAHKTLGCAECHMHSDESHTFMVVEKDDTDTIVEIKSLTCIECHNGEHELTAEELEHESHGYHDVLMALGDVLTTAGTPPQENYPYFSGTATDQGHGGAMHNWSYLHHEPGGYAHNRIYVKRLLFDSLDWLTDPATGAVQAAGSRVMDGQVTLDPATYAAAIEWLGGNPDTGVIDTRP